jgi:hypothetical protein
MISSSMPRLLFQAQVASTLAGCATVTGLLIASGNRALLSIESVKLRHISIIKESRPTLTILVSRFLVI